jgi:hypothetical protein
MAITGKTDFSLGGSNDRATLQKFYHIPLVGTQQMPVVGNLFYVSSTLGSASGPGYTPHNAFSTIDAAVGACTADNGDVIIVLPGHVETVSAAGGLDLDVAGITIIGVGNGTLQPKIDFTTSALADVDIDAANITIENLQFEASFADVAAAIDVNADDFTIRNCRFLEPTTNENFLVCIQDAAAGGSDRITVENCYAQCPDAANTHFINFAGTGDGHLLRGNLLQGDWGTMAVGGAGVVTNCKVLNNIIANAGNTVDSCINFAATATGMVFNNHCAGAAAQANGVTATAMLISQNYYGVISEDLSAILDPIAT